MSQRRRSQITLWEVFLFTILSSFLFFLISHTAFWMSANQRSWLMIYALVAISILGATIVLLSWTRGCAEVKCGELLIPLSEYSEWKTKMYGRIFSITFILLQLVCWIDWNPSSLRWSESESVALFQTYLLAMVLTGSIWFFATRIYSGELEVRERGLLIHGFWVVLWGKIVTYSWEQNSLVLVIATSNKSYTSEIFLSQQPAIEKKLKQHLPDAER